MKEERRRRQALVQEIDALFAVPARSRSDEEDSRIEMLASELRLLDSASSSSQRERRRKEEEEEDDEGTFPQLLFVTFFYDSLFSFPLFGVWVLPDESWIIGFLGRRLL